MHTTKTMLERTPIRAYRVDGFHLSLSLFSESFSLQTSLQLNCISTTIRGGLCNGNQWAIQYFAQNGFQRHFFLQVATIHFVSHFLLFYLRIIKEGNRIKS